jgi:hypothetical protein
MAWSLAAPLADYSAAVDNIIDAACDAWNKLTAQPAVITSIGMRDWAHVGHI